MQMTLEYLKEKLKRDDIVVTACSGGPDSMFLLYLLNCLKNNLNLKIICAHVNHKLRKQSEEEKMFIENYCLENNIIFEYLEINNYSDDNFHNDAHNKRYNFFETIVNKYNAKYLLTAHHGDDLMETILMRLTRGSTLFGYKGFSIDTSKETYHILRPLLYMSKKEIEDYMNSHDLKYYVDISNFSDKYTRNRYRKTVLPFLKKENSKVHLKYFEFSQSLDECNTYINKVVNNLFSISFSKDTLYLDKISNEDMFIIKLLIEKILTLYYENSTILSKKYVQMIINLIKDKKPHVSCCLPKDFIIYKSYNKLIFNYQEKFSSYQYKFDSIINIDQGVLKKIASCDSKDNFHLYLNSYEIKLPLIVRSRQNGDKILLKGINKYKKVKDIFIDEKISNSLRNSYPIVTDSQNEILWLPGLKKSKFDHSNDLNYDIILEYTLKEGELNE